MLRRLDRVPGIAGDDPPFRRFVLQRMRYSGSPVRTRDHRAILEQASRIALAHELHEIGAEGDVEDRSGSAAAAPVPRDRIDLRTAAIARRPTGYRAVSDISFLNTATADSPCSVRRDRGQRLRAASQRLRHVAACGSSRDAGGRYSDALRPGDRIGQRLGGEKTPSSRWRNRSPRPILDKNVPASIATFSFDTSSSRRQRVGRLPPSSSRRRPASSVDAAVRIDLLDRSCQPLR